MVYQDINKEELIQNRSISTTHCPTYKKKECLIVTRFSANTRKLQRKTLYYSK